MDKKMRDLMELIVAVETDSVTAKVGKIIEDIKTGWNGHTLFQYEETKRRAKAKEDK